MLKLIGIVFFLFGLTPFINPLFSQSIPAHKAAAGKKKVEIINHKPPKPSEAVIRNKKYHQAGIIAEQQLINRSSKSDKELKEKEFIIERSDKIKIEYNPKGN